MSSLLVFTLISAGCLVLACFNRGPHGWGWIDTLFVLACLHSGAALDGTRGAWWGAGFYTLAALITIVRRWVTPMPTPEPPPKPARKPARKRTATKR